MQLIPKAAEIGLHDLYICCNKVWGYVIIDNQRYRISQDRIQHYVDTGLLKRSTTDYNKKETSLGKYA